MAIILLDQRAIFVHIPKTGGLSIRAALKERALDGRLIEKTWHLSSRELMLVIPDWSTFFRFAFVRNSWDLQVSLYHYVLQRGPEHPEWNGVAGMGSFERYLDRYIRPKWLKREAGLLNEFRTQSDFCLAADGSYLLNFVGRFESLQRDFDSVCTTVGLPHRILPRKNKSVHGCYRDYYTFMSRDLIREMYRQDIDQFQFSF